jgi:hypothetical protein
MSRRNERFKYKWNEQVYDFIHNNEEDLTLSTLHLLFWAWAAPICNKCTSSVRSTEIIAVTGFFSLLVAADICAPARVVVIKV